VELASFSSPLTIKIKRHLMALSAPAVGDRLKPATFTNFILPVNAKAGMEEIR